MGRERKEFKRTSFSRNINRLFIIATEGEKTEIQYFQGLFPKNPNPQTRIYLEILSKLNYNSSPRSVIRMLDDFKREYKLIGGDELWMVIDRDKQSWNAKEISEVAKLASQKNYGFALSNPAFEVWLLLHVKDINDYTDAEIKALFKNKRIGSRTKLEKELFDICGSYNKSNLNLNYFIPYVNIAIKRAELLVKKPKERWPNYFGTHVYKLVKKLLK